MKKRIISIDTETFLARYPDHPNPTGVCIGFYDGECYEICSFKTTALLGKLENILEDSIIVGHNIAFDLHVILKKFPSLLDLVWKAMQEGRVRDTMIRNSLYQISTTGYIDPASNSLAACAEKWLGVVLPEEDKNDPEAWRYNYAKLADVPVDQYPAKALSYLESDIRVTYDLYMAQDKANTGSGRGSIKTEALQVMSAYCLRLAEIEGINVDQNKLKEIENEVESSVLPITHDLQVAGVIRENGTKDKAAIVKHLEELGAMEKTQKGNLKTSRDVLRGFIEKSDTVKKLVSLSEVEKVLTTYIPQMQFPRIHPRFNNIVKTLRTSCLGSDYYKTKGEWTGKNKLKLGHGLPSVNFQNIPRSGGLRQCFVPAEGEVFLCADYSNLELVCAAQMLYEKYGPNHMWSYLNKGNNYHDIMGHQLFRFFEDNEVELDEYMKKLSQNDGSAKHYRQMAKPINLGIPGGQGVNRIREAAEQTYGVTLSTMDAEYCRETFCNTCPEMVRYLKYDMQELKNGGFKYKDGKQIPLYDIVICGIHMANKTYTEAANSIFMQVRAAIGVKIAMTMLCRDIQTNRDSPLYRAKFHAVIHDEFLISIKEGKAQEGRDRMADLMLQGMQQVCPHTMVGCEAMIMNSWGKSSDDTKKYQLKSNEVGYVG